MTTMIRKLYFIPLYRVVLLILLRLNQSNALSVKNVMHVSSSLLQTSPYEHPVSAIARNSKRFCLYSSTKTDDNNPTDVATGTEDDSSNAQSSLFDWNAQWYPVIPLSYLSDKPVPVTIMGKPLVVWKDNEDNVSVFHDSCPHRMAPLSTGKIVQVEEANENGDSSKPFPSCRLKCRFHGWEFEGNGACSRMPMLTEQEQEAMNKSSPNGAPKVFSPEVFHTRVTKGLIWAFLDTSIPEDKLPEIPEENLPTDSESEGADWLFNRNPISFQSMTENSFDPAHAPFTHEGMTGFNGNKFSPNDVLPMSKYEVKSYGPSGFELHHTPYERSTAERLVLIL